jgi:hypothetical protein
MFEDVSTPSPFHATNSFTLSTESSMTWLFAYFASNLALTIYNKLVLAGNFPFPYTLTAVHCLFGTLGSTFFLKRRAFAQARLSMKETILVVLFSALYTINIIVSNVSLYVPKTILVDDRHLVTVPFHQIVRSTTPLFVIAISIVFLEKSYTRQIYISLIPVSNKNEKVLC